MTVTVIGAGLSGCEAAWQLAQRGVDVVLYEMKPEKKTPQPSNGADRPICGAADTFPAA